MKIGLITTNTSTAEIGSRIISSLLKESGHKTKMIFLPTTDKTYTAKILEETQRRVEKSDMIAVSSVSISTPRTIQLLTNIRKTDIPVVWGGIHATLQPLQCLDYVDFVCVGEGEYAILELVDSIESGRSPYTIQNMWMRSKGKNIKNKLRPLVKNLDSLPFQDYNIKNHYILEKERLVEFKYNHVGKWDLFGNTFIDSFKLDKQTNNPSAMFITMTTRGCPETCSYCCNEHIKRIYSNETNFIRKRSANNVIEEISMIKKKFPISNIWLIDDDFLLRTPSEIEDFSRHYKEEINLPFMIVFYGRI